MTVRVPREADEGPSVISHPSSVIASEASPSPPIVRLLPEVVANQIAAGEVVERPASVVKELVENALDAGATRIEVSVEQGGAKLVQVDDNGCGMDRESACLALQRQATSKIATVHDIERIATFGFRGEAIPSIASVSRFTLTTRPRAQADATRLTVVGGKLEEVVPAGHPFGTTIAVSDLFFNTPARKKFLRSANTELARIRQTLSAVALANPTVALRLISEGRDLLRLPQGDTLDDRVRALLGQPTADALLPLDHTSGPFHIHGYLSKPGYVRGGTPEQFIFINRRPATAPQIQVALRQAWPLRDSRPLVILFVDLPPEEVDVNVHPTKREVRFRRGNLVGDAIAQAIARALAEAFPAPGAQTFDHSLPAGTAPTPPPTVAPTPPVPPPPVAPPAPHPLVSNPFPPFPLSPVAPLPTPQAPKPRQQALDFPGLASTPPGKDPAAPPSPWKWLRIADILQERYYLVVTDQGYLVVDAKAALERILYERILADTERAPATQPLLIPETLHLPLLDAERVTR
ncbi:MAG: DNA mismatch repair endonuclease MutL, partial [Candidatus Spyradenecus sp.]